MNGTLNGTLETGSAAEEPRKGITIKIFCVGTTGSRVMECLMQAGVPASLFVAVDAGTPPAVSSPPGETLHLETRLLRGLGTGGDPERGRAAAEEHLPRLKALCEGADVVFIVAGLGGGAGTGISPVLARAAKECGALALGFVTTPFGCEGSRRQQLAREGLADLKSAADGVICLPNQRIFKLIDENTSVLDTFKITNGFLADGVRGVWRALTQAGLMEVPFADFCSLMRNRHSEGCFAVAEAAGPARGREVMDKLLAHPMLEGGHVLGEADAVLVSLAGGPDLTMAEIDRLMEQINRHCEHAQVIMGAAIDESLRDRLAVTLVASRKAAPPADEDEQPATAAEGLDMQLLDRLAPARCGSRFVPPAPALAPEQMAQLMARQNRGGAARQRRNSSQARQTQLPLEIISKGRFDKSEPTIHKGEDLDVPTYIRRGVALN
jgi:cell division protein FtsZ